MAELVSIDKDPDIICMSETFTQKGSESNIRLHDYYLTASYCRKNNKKRGGVCILVKRGINCKVLTEVSSLSQDSYLECCGIHIHK